jgi:hypothetical protein
MKMNSGGTAIRKLNATEAARSLSPICCVCLKKKCSTSYNGRPSKPGKTSFFDQLITAFIGLLSIRIL